MANLKGMLRLTQRRKEFLATEAQRHRERNFRGKKEWHNGTNVEEFVFCCPERGYWACLILPSTKVLGYFQKMALMKYLAVWEIALKLGYSMSPSV